MPSPLVPPQFKFISYVRCNLHLGQRNVLFLFFLLFLLLLLLFFYYFYSCATEKWYGRGRKSMPTRPSGSVDDPAYHCPLLTLMSR